MKNRILTDFGLGLIIGFIATLIIFSVITGIYFYRVKEKELIENVQKQIEIQELREDYSNRDPVEFLEIPGVRGAADTATAEFERKRDEAIQRFRSRITD